MVKIQVFITWKLQKSSQLALRMSQMLFSLVFIACSARGWWLKTAADSRNSSTSKIQWKLCSRNYRCFQNTCERMCLNLSKTKNFLTASDEDVPQEKRSLIYALAIVHFEE
jgi:hypothetical protein